MGRYKKLNYTKMLRFRVEEELFKEFEEVVGRGNVSKSLRKFMSETVEEAQKKEEKPVK